jgi:hypothetical protein
MAAAKQLAKPGDFGSRTAARAESRRQAIFARDVEVERAKAAATTALANFASVDAQEVAAFEAETQAIAVDIQTRLFATLAPLIAEFEADDNKATASRIASVVFNADQESRDMVGESLTTEWVVPMAFVESALLRQPDVILMDPLKFLENS